MTLESSSFVFCCFVLFVFSNIVRRCVCTDVMNVILMIVFIEFPFVCNALFVLLLRQTRSLLGANRLCSRRWSATRAGRLRRPALPGFAGFADRHYPGTREKGKSQLPAIGGLAWTRRQSRAVATRANRANSLFFVAYVHEKFCGEQ